MLLSKENIILEPNKNYVQIGRLFDETEYSLINICGIKTTLLPTIKIQTDLYVKCPHFYKENNKHYLQNKFIKAKDITENDYLYIPKIENIENEIVDECIAFLYGKYIASGYIKQNKEPQIIIPIRNISPEYINNIKSIENIIVIPYNFENFKKIIIINNKDIIKLFSNFTKNKKLKQFIINSKSEIFNIFMDSIIEEFIDGKIMLDNLTLSHELFLHTYSKLNKVLKITEIRRTSKSKQSRKKKKYFLSIAETNEYEILNKNLYVRVINNRLGSNTKGIDLNKHLIYNNEKFICNSIEISGNS